jgi:hypothetical protein
MLTPAQLKERALNKIDAKLFFAQKDLERNALEIDGVISSKIDTESLMNIRHSYQSEVDVLRYIKQAIEKFSSKLDESQLDLEDLINQMTER